MVVMVGYSNVRLGVVYMCVCVCQCGVYEWVLVMCYCSVSCVIWWSYACVC